MWTILRAGHFRLPRPRDGHPSCTGFSARGFAGPKATTCNLPVMQTGSGTEGHYPFRGLDWTTTTNYNAPGMQEGARTRKQDYSGGTSGVCLYTSDTSWYCPRNPPRGFRSEAANRRERLGLLHGSTWQPLQLLGPASQLHIAPPLGPAPTAVGGGRWGSGSGWTSSASAPWRWSR